jgi:uncharacterized membrane protein
MGFIRCCINLIVGKKQKITDLFYYYSSLKLLLKCVYLFFQFIIRFVFYVLIFMSLPTLFLYYLAEIWKLHVINEIFLELGCILCLLSGIVCLCILFIFITRYFMVPYLFICSENVSVRQCIKKSIIFMKKKKVKTIKFAFSFIGWMLLNIVFYILNSKFRLGELFLIPYFTTSLAIYAICLMGLDYKKSSIE